MAWVKLTDDFTEHRKLLEAGPLASWLWVVGLAWSNRNGSDGKLPRAVVPRLANFDGVGVYTGTYSGQDVDVQDLAATLVNVGLWEEVEGGFYIHDYSDYQLTTDELASMREKKSAAGKAGASARAKARAATDDRADVAADGQPVSRNPSVPISSSNGSGRELPDGLWMKVAEEKLKLQPPGSVSNPDGWLPATARDAERKMTERARTLYERFDVSLSQLACALVTGRTDTWGPYERKQAG